MPEHSRQMLLVQKRRLAARDKRRDGDGQLLIIRLAVKVLNEHLENVPYQLLTSVFMEDERPQHSDEALVRFGLPGTRPRYQNRDQDEWRGHQCQASTHHFHTSFLNHADIYRRRGLFPCPYHKPLVRVTQIGEYIRHQSCERRFKLDHDNRRLTKSLPFFYTLSSAMDPVLEEAGRAREREWERWLTQAGLRDIGEGPEVEATPWEVFAGRVAELKVGEAAFAREVEVSGELGAFRLVGRIDFALLLWRDGKPLLRLVECKASRKDKTYQRVQVALYRQLVRRRWEDLEIECVVARIDAETNAVQDMLALPPLDLTMEEADAAQLLAEGGPLASVLGQDIADIPYQLDSKCDDCALNVYCLPEAARRRDLELLGMDAGAARALRAAGVADMDALAALALDSEAARRVRADAEFRREPGRAGARRRRCAARRCPVSRSRRCAT